MWAEIKFVKHKNSSKSVNVSDFLFGFLKGWI